MNVSNILSMYFFIFKVLRQHCCDYIGPALFLSLFALV